MKKLTIKEIATLSGVSISTVSNVINKKGKCSIKTKEKIYSIINEVGYRPNQTARTLANKKSNLIGVLFSIEDEMLKKNSSHKQIINSIISELSIKSYDLVVGTITDNFDVDQWVLKRDLEGLIIIGNIDQLDKKIIDIPIVFIDNYKNNFNEMNYINTNDTIGGFLATEILIKNKCKNIAFISSENTETHNQRYLGYQTALMEYSLGEGELYLEKSTYEGGLILGTKIASTKIDGLCIGSDEMAFGVISSLVKKGKRIPEDLKVIGFDNVEACKYTTPSLSSVDLNFSTKGKLAVQMIFNELENKSFLRNQLVDLNIILRESTAQ